IFHVTYTSDSTPSELWNEFGQWAGFDKVSEFRKKFRHHCRRIWTKINHAPEYNGPDVPECDGSDISECDGPEQDGPELLTPALVRFRGVQIYACYGNQVLLAMPSLFLLAMFGLGGGRAKPAMIDSDDEAVPFYD
ncbi:12288_t:CDS:2, partial [Cetraspora pellucida]